MEMQPLKLFQVNEEHSIMRCPHPASEVEDTGQKILVDCSRSPTGKRLRIVFRCRKCGKEFTANNIKGG